MFPLHLVLAVSRMSYRCPCRHCCSIGCWNWMCWSCFDSSSHRPSRRWTLLSFVVCARCNLVVVVQMEVQLHSGYKMVACLHKLQIVLVVVAGRIGLVVVELVECIERAAV